MSTSLVNVRDAAEAEAEKTRGKISMRREGRKRKEEKEEEARDRHRENREGCREVGETYDSQGKFRCDLHVSRKLT